MQRGWTQRQYVESKIWDYNYLISIYFIVANKNLRVTDINLSYSDYIHYPTNSLC